MKYVAILKQASEGCDYTIGCGINVIEYDSSTTMEAALALKELIKTNYSNPENRLKEVKLLEAPRLFEVDLQRWYNEIDTEEKKRMEDETRKKELAELERLKKKYEKA